MFVFGYLAAVGVIAVWGRRADPELMRERSQPGENVKSWDRIIMSIYTVLLIIMLALASLDSGRFDWTSPSSIIRILAWVGVVLAFALVWWSMASNTYLSEFVRIQEDRGQRVATSGPYKYVRHPMYDGIILAVLCAPLILGSFWALIPAVLIVMLFIIRTALEDQTLLEELPGYREYARQVRYRLVPLVW